MPVPHLERFEGCTVGQPVTSENTSFHRFLDEIQSAGTCVATGLYGSQAMQISLATAQNVGWLDTGLMDAFGTEDTTSDRFAVMMYLRVDSAPVGATATVMWVSERTVAIVPPILSIGVTTTLNLVGTGLTLESGSALIPLGEWVRITMEAADDGANNLLVVADMWTGANIDSADQADRACRLSGVLAGGTPDVNLSWLMFGRHGQTSPTGGTITLDRVQFDTWPQPPDLDPAYTGPGMHWWDGEKTRKADLRGWWDGTAVQPVDFLGIWDGATIQPGTP